MVTGRFLSLGLLFLLGLGGANMVRAERAWETFENCALDRNDSNDGDSFHVVCGKKRLYLRLYFVDSPETDGRYPDRVAEQAREFGVTSAEAMEIGKAATMFTREKLGGPFRVITRFENAKGGSDDRRSFAFVLGPSWDLAEELVANGLARVYGKESEAPGMPSTRAYWAKAGADKELSTRAETRWLGDQKRPAGDAGRRSRTI